ncbi:hypothetical protein F5Y07DRAFT_399371 [Xylaria sp. FL0933]|nr:hypothetical protein F5Y07DRAFT_399371 [Xylaria sp. FL0933]
MTVQAEKTEQRWECKTQGCHVAVRYRNGLCSIHRREEAERENEWRMRMMISGKCSICDTEVGDLPSQLCARCRGQNHWMKFHHPTKRRRYRPKSYNATMGASASAPPDAAANGAANGAANEASNEAANETANETANKVANKVADEAANEAANILVDISATDASQGMREEPRTEAPDNVAEDAQASRRRNSRYSLRALKKKVYRYASSL